MSSAKKKQIIHDLEKIKGQLKQRKQELDEYFAKFPEEKFSDSTIQDTGDQALSSSMESLRSSLQDTRLEEYRRVVKALEMIDEGTYGICVDCGNAIAEKRLRWYPNATRCLVCQEAFEET